MTFGERVKRTREKRGLTQRQLALEAGIPQATVSRLESGVHGDVHLSVAKALAKALGVALDYLAGMYEDEDDEPSLALAGASETG